MSKILFFCWFCHPHTGFLCDSAFNIRSKKFQGHLSNLFKSLFFFANDKKIVAIDINFSKWWLVIFFFELWILSFQVVLVFQTFDGMVLNVTTMPWLWICWGHLWRICSISAQEGSPWKRCWCWLTRWYTALNSFIEKTSSTETLNLTIFSWEELEISRCYM